MADRPTGSAEALWYTGPKAAEIRTEPLFNPESGEVRVRALFSAISRGTERLIFNGRVPDSEFELECELVLLALGFLGPERQGVVGELGLELGPTGNVACDEGWQTSRERVFVCGDMARGQSLIVWAIAEGRSCAASVDRWLTGDSALPSPLRPGQLALR